MARLAISGLLAILALAQYSQAIEIQDCIKLALEKGVPGLRIPSHNPLVFTHDVPFNFDNVLGQKLSFVLKNLIWDNIPFYTITEDKVISENNVTRQLQGAIKWDNFTLSSKFDYQLGNDSRQGDIAITLKNVVWSAEWEETVANATGHRAINTLTLKQSSESRQIKSTGWGENTVAADNLLLALFDIVVELHVNRFNLIGKGLVSKINQFWYGNPSYYNRFVQWCDSQIA